MTKTNRFWKFVLISLSGILICVSGLLSFIWFRLPLYQKTAFMEMGQENIYLILALGFIVIGSLWAVFDITYNRYILPLKRISAEAEMIYNSNPSHRIEIKGSRDILCMAEVINDFADMFENLNRNITQQILSARQETDKERNLLAAIMGELPQGIIICNKNGRVILFNSMARSFFTQTGQSASGEQFLGLGRSVFHLIDKSLIAHAMDEILEQINTPNSTVGSFFITPIISGLLIAAEAIPVLDTDKGITGFILMLQDVSEKIKKYQIIDRELNRFSSHLKNHSDLEQFEKMGTRIRSSFFTKLPSTQITLDAFLPAVQKKSGYQDDIRVNIYNPVPATRFLADTYSMTQGFVFIFKKLSGFTGLTEFDLVVEQDEGTIFFTIEWE